MRKFYKIIIGIIIVVVLALIAIGYALKPSSPIVNEDRISNIDESLDVAKINKEILKTVRVKDGKLNASMEINDDLFKKILKNTLVNSNNQKLQESSVNLDQDDVIMKYPRKVGLWDTQVDVKMKAEEQDGNLVLTVHDVKLGKIKVADSVFMKKLEKMMEGKSNIVSTDKNKIYVNLKSSNVSIDNIVLKDSILKVDFSLTKENLINIGGDIVGSILTF
ncbi:MAG: hypothetical protein RR561_00175 [Peptostreptococcus sp.]|uniref:hypothetical protein n=1 Tax=Peptostreptococcus sp. TaxID=1262 RepID=UPI002FC901B5